MAFRFNQDLQEIRRLMGRIEWRIEMLKDHPQLLLLTRVVRASLEDLHDRFHANSFQHSMVKEAKLAFSHVLLAGVGDSICSNPKEIFVAENPTKVGKQFEALLYYSLCEDYGTLWFGMEFFYLTRDVNDTFKICQSYGFWSDNKYDVEALRELVEKMEWMRRGLNAYR